MTDIQRFLLVDDDPSDLALTLLVLRQAFPHALVEGDADPLSLSQRLEQGDFAVLVTERNLGWGAGLEVLRAARRRAPGCSLFLFSREPAGNLGPELLDLGLSGYLVKDSAGYVALPEAVRAALAQPRQALPETAAGQWDGVVERLPLGVFSVSLEGTIIRASQAVSKLLGLPLWSELVGRDIRNLFPQDTMGVSWEQLRAGDRKSISGELPLSGAGQGGARVRVRCWREAAGAGAGDVWHGLIERIDAEDVSASGPPSGTDAWSTGGECEQLVYAISHDLQEPLQIVNRHAHLLLERHAGALGDDAGRLVRNLGASADRMQSMIDSILEYSRIDRQQSPMPVVNLEQVLDEALSIMQLTLQEADATLHRNPMPSLPGNRRQLVQLFQNLIGNAVKFRSERALHITVGVRDTGSQWTFAVKDNGIGIHERFHDRIFSMFQRLHTQEEYPGSGIGLALCKRIVEHHGGRIWVRSATGEGTTVYFTIPKNLELQQRASGGDAGGQAE